MEIKKNNISNGDLTLAKIGNDNDDELKSFKDLMGDDRAPFTNVTQLYINILDDLLLEANIPSAAMSKKDGAINIEKIQEIGGTGSNSADVTIRINGFTESFKCKFIVFKDEYNDETYMYYFIFPFGVAYCRQPIGIHEVKWQEFIFAGINIPEKASHIVEQHNYNREMIDIKDFPWNINGIHESFTEDVIAEYNTIVDYVYNAIAINYDDILDKHNDGEPIKLTDIFTQESLSKIIK